MFVEQLEQSPHTNYIVDMSSNENILATENTALLALKIQQEEEQNSVVEVKISRVSLPADTDLVMLLYYLTTKQYLKIQPPTISQVFVGVDTFDEKNPEQEVVRWKSISSFFPQFGYLGSDEQQTLWENVVRTHLGGNKPVHIKITTKKPLVMINTPVQIVTQPALPDPFGFTLMEEFLADALKSFSSVCDELFDLFFRSNKKKQETRKVFKTSSQPVIVPELPQDFQQGPSSVISSPNYPFPIFKSSTKLQQSTFQPTSSNAVEEENNDDDDDELIEIIEETEEEEEEEEVVCKNPLLEVDREQEAFPNAIENFFQEGSSETEPIPLKEQTLEERYAFHLDILEQMGFADKELNLKKLQEHEGNFVDVVKSLTLE